MNKQIKNPGVFGDNLQKSKNSMSSAMKILSKHSDINDSNTVIYEINENVKRARSHIPNASRSKSTMVSAIDNLKTSVNSLEEAYSQVQILTGDSVISDAYGHIRRALDYLNMAIKQIKDDNEINALIQKISKLLRSSKK